MEKLKLILACIFTAICWTSLCLDWDLLMYASGMMALIITWNLDRKKPSEFKNQEDRKH